MEAKESLDLADDFQASALWIQDLIEEAKEGAADGIDAVPAAWALVGLGEQARGQEGTKEGIEVKEALLAEGLEAGAQGGQALTPLREERCMHNTVYVLCLLDVQCKMQSMKENLSASIGTLKREYARLRQSLARTGYISQGSVLHRSVATSGRSGYQWTRKQRRKTITVSLSREQYVGMKQAVANERALWKTIQKMEKLSRQILFGSLPDTSRRKRLGKRVLGLI